MKQNDIFKKHQIIAVDCDDVLSETFSYLLEYFNLKNIFGEKIKLTDIKNYNFSQNENFGKTSDESVQMFIELFEKDIDSYKIPPVKGAFEILKKLKNSGKKLYVITARQSFFEEYTKKWIHKHFPNIFEDIYFCNHEGGGKYIEKVDICEQIGATVLLDDSFSNVKKCLENNIEVILFDKPWNKDYAFDSDKMIRISIWEELSIKD